MRRAFTPHCICILGVVINPLLVSDDFLIRGRLVVDIAVRSRGDSKSVHSFLTLIIFTSGHEWTTSVSCTDVTLNFLDDGFSLLQALQADLGRFKLLVGTHH